MSTKPVLVVGNPQSVAASITSVSLFGANGAAKFRSIFNESTANLFVLFNGVNASLTLYTVKVLPGTYYEFNNFYLYNNQVNGIWDAANGFARTMEF